MLKPNVSAPRNRFCRLFPPACDAAPASDLVALARSMSGPETPIVKSVRRSEPIGAAYTYFGQFIDHDLIRDRTTFADAGALLPDATQNERTPWLDLDALYGEGPASEKDGALYAADHASFRLGEAAIDGEAFDLPLAANQPQLADIRNNENVVVRQLHAVFLKLHNAAVDELKATGASGATLFHQAQQRVQWQYQWLVRHDYLRRICQSEVYNEVVTHGRHRIDWSGGFAIPVEFSQAAFRFGHSMVREHYNLGRNGSRQRFHLHELFCLGRHGALSPELAVDWNRFVLGPETSMRIDTMIVPPLFSLPADAIHLFVSNPPPHGPYELAVRTVLRGDKMKLVSGQQACAALCPDKSISDPGAPIARGYDPWMNLRQLGLSTSTPLWYYILLEAELQENGLKLGTLGSWIVAEVIQGCLRADAESFVCKCGSDWTPPPWRLQDGQEVIITDLLDLAVVAGLA